MNLTPHFSLEELTASETAERNGWDNSPNDTELANLTRLADFLEQVKVVLKKWYRLRSDHPRV
jgi:zinc D-Ala-D-Ala carboxypeptidase